MDSVTICNLSLMAAGMAPITELGENSNSGRLCKIFYPVVRDRVLRDHIWSFAQFYCVLSQNNEESPDRDFPVICNLPGDLVRIVKVNEGDTYKRVSDRIMLKTLPATLLYIRKVEDPNLFDAAFTDALQQLLAAEISLASSRDIQQAQYFRNQYQEKLAIARSIDSQENVYFSEKKKKYSSFIEARGHHSSRSNGRITFVEGDSGRQRGF